MLCHVSLPCSTKSPPQQSCFRGYIDYTRYVKTCDSIIEAQCFVRRHQSRRLLKQLKREVKEIKVQRIKREREIQRLRKEFWKGEKKKYRKNQPPERKVKNDSLDQHPETPSKDGISLTPLTRTSPLSVRDMH